MVLNQTLPSLLLVEQSLDSEQDEDFQSVPGSESGGDSSDDFTNLELISNSEV